MKIRLRVTLLLVSLLAVFGLAVFLLENSQQAEGSAIRLSLEEDRSVLLTHVMRLTADTLQNYASDYAQWDEMRTFTQAPSSEWARVNIDPSLLNFDAQAAWVFAPDGRRIYAKTQPPLTDEDAPPFTDPAFREQLQQSRGLQYFQESKHGLLEICVAPVLRSSDLKREGPPDSWFAVARRWDDTRLKRLGEVLGARASLINRTDQALAESNAIRLNRVLTDWQGRPTRVLRVQFESRLLERLSEGNRDELILLSAYGCASILVLLISLTIWLVRPMHLITQSLRSESPEPLGQLRQGRDEFGELARLVDQSFTQRHALQESENLLRQSLELRGRLARDLHDGLIQTIYAVGLGLETSRTLRASNPAAADERLRVCQKMLSQSLWQVRSFIEALEPESEEPLNLVDALQTLAGTMHSLQAVEIVAKLDPHAAAKVASYQETHLLQMAREGISNAIRHAGAKRIELLLWAETNGAPVLEIVDDGIGFDPGAAAGKGRGLANLASRAAELGADLVIDSGPGDGTSIRITLRLSSR